MQVAFHPLQMLVAVCLCSGWLATGLGTSDARADGGTIRLQDSFGNLRVTVFTSPTPVRVGQLDVSILVQDQAGLTAEKSIEVVAQPLDSHAPPRRIPATRANATNKLLQAATIEVDHPGRWRIEVQLGPPGQPAQRLAFDVAVAPALPRWLTLWPWFSWPAGVIALFGLYQWLAQRQCRPPFRIGQVDRQ